MTGAVIRMRSLAERLLVGGSAIVLFWMMMLTVCDVVLRYVFSMPIRGAYELTELSLAILIYLGLPLVSLRNVHIATDLIDPYLRGRFRRILPVIIDLVCGGALAAVSIVLFGKAARLATSGDTTTVLNLALYPVAYVVAALMAVAALIHLLRGAGGASTAESTNVI